MQRIAVPMIGGMISSTLLTLIVIPAIFGLVKGFRLPSSVSGAPLPPARQVGAEEPARIPESVE
jgi:Cu(I)/Ag(I) efflux system membrane protein CusA/SilA